MRNILLNLIAVLLVFSIQGCWAGQTKSEISKDGKSIESDPIDPDLEVNGQNDSRTIRHYEKLAWVWGELRDYRKAIHYYEKALAGDLNIYGESHVEVADHQSHLGWAWANLGEYGMSKVHFQLALDGYLKNYEEDHLLVIQTRHNLKKINGVLK